MREFGRSGTHTHSFGVDQRLACQTHLPSKLYTKLCGCEGHDNLATHQHVCLQDKTIVSFFQKCVGCAIHNHHSMMSEHYRWFRARCANTMCPISGRLGPLPGAAHASVFTGEMQSCRARVAVTPECRGAYSDEPDNSRWTFRAPARNMRSEAREIRTPNLLIWSQTRCHCAIAPLVRDTKFQEHSFKNAK